MQNKTDSKKRLIAANQNIKERDYWLDKLAGELPGSAFPCDHYEGLKHYQPGYARFQLEHESVTQLANLCNGSDYSLHAFLVTILAVLLNKYTGQTDIILGTPIYRQALKGEYINTVLPLRSQLENNMTCKDLLLQMSQTITAAVENQSYPMDILAKQLDLPSYGDTFPLFEVAILLENIQDKCNLQHITTHLLISFLNQDHSLQGSVEFNSSAYDPDTIEGIIKHFKRAAKKILKNVTARIADIDILSPTEKEQLLTLFNDMKMEYPEDKTLHQLFENQVIKNPGCIALTCGHRSLTFGELNKTANRLARYLRKKGVKANTIVSLIIDPMLEMVVGILGILKAGGAYLPIDHNSPEERIRYILKDCAVTLVLTRECFFYPIGREYRFIDLQDKALYEQEQEDENLTVITRSTDLANVISTSGSRGKPKSVLIAHRGMNNYILWRIKTYAFTSNDRTLQLISVIFDGFGGNLYCGLLSGGNVILLEDDRLRDFDHIKRLIARQQITNMGIVPPMYKLILEDLHPGDLQSLRFISLAGERADKELILTSEKINREILLINEYGPTENTITTTAYFGMKPDNVSIIGKPIFNNQLFILGKTDNLLPINVPGELCISGDGLAKGYLNRVELTGKRFIPNPFFPSKMMYCTGDLAKWLPDGNIQLLGRIDDQVKIKGYRVELGEIQNQLLNHEKIDAAVVIVRQDEMSNSYLCAYYSTKISTETERPGIPAADLREYLSRKLPIYMLPSYFVPMEKIPLRGNGKVIRELLPPLGISSLTSTGEYRAPRNTLEKTLVQTWQQVLGKDRVGIDDNFFILGGDSIKAIQIASRMNKAEYKISMRDIFIQPTIAQLAPRVRILERRAIQSFISGTVPLTPVQEEFFNITRVDPHHNNHAVMFHTKETFEKEAIESVFRKIQEHHDALRMTFKKEKNGKIVQTNHGLNYPVSVTEFDLGGQEHSHHQLQIRVNQIQASIDLEKGPLLKVGIFHLDDGDRLLIVIHHLVIDTVSWRILFADIETLYQQYKRREPFELPLKTDSFKLYAEKLCQYANSKSFLKEKSYWKTLDSAGTTQIKKDFEIEDNYVQDAVHRSFSIGRQETELLLTKVNDAFGTEINDILLTAVGLGIKEHFGTAKVIVAMEGHGREEILPDLDITRTVGWFTSLYPAILDLTYDKDLARQIMEIKERLHRLPNKGIGYGILKHLTDAAYKQDMDFHLKPQISFNYLGQFDADMEQMSFDMAREPIGNFMSKKSRRDYDIEITGLVEKKRLFIRLTFNKKHFKPGTIEALLSHIKEQLLHIISFCSARKTRELTPVDFTYKELSIDLLEQLKTRYQSEIQDIYRLSPMQEGILFHELYNRSFSQYSQQYSYRLQGEINPQVIKKSLNEIVKRCDILRTVFIHEGLKHPVQLVLKQREVDFQFHDIRGDSAGDPRKKEMLIKEFKTKSREKTMDLSRDSLMQISFVQLGNNEFELIMYISHILMDGWCTSILLSQFLEIYRSFLQNTPPRLPEVKQYGIFIQWLEKLDPDASRNYWQEYLQNYNKPTRVPQKNKKEASTGKEKKEIEKKVTGISFDSQYVSSLNRLAASHQVTLNTIVQCVWGILLGNYNGTTDVVFGSVVSGRPAEIDGIESMIGLFINTIPVRIRYEKNTTFLSLAQEVQKVAVESEPYHHYPLAEIQAQSPLKQELIDHFLVFENYPVVNLEPGENDHRHQGDGKEIFRLLHIDAYERVNYDFYMQVDCKEHLRVKLLYNPRLYEEHVINQMTSHFREVLDQTIENPEISIKNIKISHQLLAAQSDIRDSGDFGF